jgi:hypothetical protein
VEFLQDTVLLLLHLVWWFLRTGWENLNSPAPLYVVFIVGFFAYVMARDAAIARLKKEQEKRDGR